ncbi:LysE family translocator [uncultured Roseobacter sp.]|uniref:LysE family translocator n=1 Tax=uncultured Roseobacter sp. TaxID=114847 RepID=UPI00260FDF6C|nr:LysE family translocator [uncultured Roseobacter sp.]
METAETLIPLSLVLIGWMIAGGSPGPATLAISGTSMQQGRLAGLTIAFGILAGSASWGIAAAMGFSAVMMANVWLIEVLRYLGAGYLFWLALRSLRSAWRGGSLTSPEVRRAHLFRRGMLLHLTNPKAVLGWGAIYAIALPPQAAPWDVWSLFASLFACSCVVFLGYALVFSWGPVARGYARARRIFDVAFGVLFGLAGLRILTARFV